MYRNSKNKNSSPKVQILLSTYNGEKYLNPLLKSLIEQQYSNFSILIRDDGSSDETPDILKAYKNVDNIEIRFGKNIGVINSFFKLLVWADEGDYIAFCDQDDMWHKEKLSRAVSEFERRAQKEIPAMYFGRYTIVDENLGIIGYSKKPSRPLDFPNALVENVASGCTLVINRKARDLLINKIPEKCLMHDWWIYLVLTAFGVIIYDEIPLVFYRQHSDNYFGASETFLKKWSKRFLSFRNWWASHKVMEQATEFKRIFYGNLPNEKKEILDGFINSQKSFCQRLNYALFGQIYRQSRLDEILLRFLILLGKI